MVEKWNELEGKKYLTPRERDVVRLLAKGHSPKVVATMLKISYWTVMNHLSHMQRRLKSNGYDLVYQANILGCLG